MDRPPPSEPGTIQDDLLRWYDRARRDLPWRRTPDPYAVWVSEVMLQQTQVETVIPYWQRFLETFPTVERLARAPLEEVLGHWRGLGYYSRARNLHRAAQQITEHFGGRLPADPQALASLPTFGRYTVGAVGSIAFGLRLPLVDGNVGRVLSRLFLIEGAPGDRRREQALWDRAGALVANERPGDWNQALMELGATVCRPVQPNCPDCPLRSACAAHAQGRQQELPAPKPKAPSPHLRLASVAVFQHDKLLLALRPPRGLFGGLWELPSVEREGSRPAEQLLRRHFGSWLVPGDKVGVVRRTLTHRRLRVEIFAATGQSPPRRLPPYEALRFVAPDELPRLGVSTAMQLAIQQAFSCRPARRPAKAPKNR